MPNPAKALLLVRDPYLPWAGPFPYDLLSAQLQEMGKPGLGPTSTLAEIQDALFDLMSGSVTPEVQSAWDELSLLGQRLVVDFFMYQLAEPVPGLEPRSGSASDEAAISPPEKSLGIHPAREQVGSGCRTEPTDFLVGRGNTTDPGPAPTGTPLPASWFSLEEDPHGDQ